MKMTRRILAWALAIAMLITCGITGLVLPAAAEEAVNLFVNGDFEGETKTPWETDTYIIAGEGKDGGKGYYHNRTQTSVHSATGQVRYKAGLWNKLETNTTYILSFDYKTSGEAFGQLYFDVSPAESIEASGYDLAKSVDTWVEKTITFTTGDTVKTNSTWEFSIRTRGGAGEVWYDNLKLVKAPAEVAFAEETMKADLGESFTLAPELVNLTMADLAWESNAEAVATVENGVVTAKALGTAVITAKNGDAEASITVEVVKDKTRVDIAIDNFTHDAAVTDKWAKGDKVAVKVDEATGIRYASIEGEGSAYTLKTPSLPAVKTGEILAISFKIRKTTGAGSIRYVVDTWAPGQYNDHANYIKGTSTYDNTKWYTFTSYYYANSDMAAPYTKISLNGSTTDGILADIADFYVYKVDPEEVNLFGDGTFDEGMSVHVAGYQADGVYKRPTANIENDPADATNKVLHYTSTDRAQTYLMPAKRCQYINGTKTVYSLSKGDIFKITYRQKGTGYTTITGHESYSDVLLTEGEPTKASSEWKTVTAYIQVKWEPVNSSYTTYSFDLSIYGDIYLDDFAMYKVDNATSFELVLNENMPIYSTQTVSLKTIPEHAYPGKNITITSSNACITVSGTTLTATKTTGSVTGATITATSGDLTDAEGNPITSSKEVTLVYPKEIFTGAIDGTMDSAEFAGWKWYYAAPMSVTADPDDASNQVLKIDTTVPGKAGYTLYFQNVNLQSLKPNSLYRYSFKVKADESVSMIPAYDNRCVDIQFYAPGAAHTKVHGEWLTVYAWIKTGDAPSFNAANWNLQFMYNDSDQTTPIYMDDFSFALIDEYENLFSGNTDLNSFDRYMWDSYSGNQLALVEDPKDPSNTVFRISGTAGGTKEGLRIPYLQPYAVYEISFDTMVDQDWIDGGAKAKIWWNGSKEGESRMFSARGDDAFYTTTEWQKNKYYVFTGATAQINAQAFDFDHTAGTGGYLYIDNYSVKRVDNNHSLFGVLSGGYDIRFRINGGNWVNYALDVPAGANVQVTVREHGGGLNKLLMPMTLKTNNGESVILNKDIANGYSEEKFGTGDGRTLEFTMPAEAARVSAVLADATNTNYVMGTLGTSLRYTDIENDVFDGIRFLTRVAMPGGVFDATDPDNFTVMKDGVTYNVLEIGSLLKRYSETDGVEDELTLENAKSNWTAIAYKRGETDMKLLDYTGCYIDFASVMKKGESLDQDVFNARKYTARGYMILENAETGEQITVLADSQTSDSVNSVRARIPA